MLRIILSLWLAITPAFAGQSGLLLGVSAVSSGGGGFSLTWKSSATIGSSGGPTYDYGTMSYGSGCTRVVAANLWIPSGAAQTITGITIGGVALTQVSGAYVQAANAGANADIWESSAPLSGTSGDVQVTYSANLSYNSSVALYCLVTTTPTASTAKVASANFGSSASTSGLVIPSGGGGVAIMAGGNGTAMTFTNAAVDSAITPGGNNAYYGHTTSTGSVTVSATTVSGSDSIALSVAAWSP